MAPFDTDRNRTIGNRLDPRNATSYMPWIVGAILVAAAAYLFLGDTFTDRTATPPTVTSPQTAPK
jgi:hypothetical protein